MFKHIIVPLDGSEMAEAALPAALYFAQCFSAKISLIHLIEKGLPQSVHEQQHLHKDTEAVAYLMKIAASFPQGTNVDYHVHSDEVSHVAQSIVDHSMIELNSDLVIMCTHGGDDIRRFVVGSIAQQVIARGTVPVLVVHATEGYSDTFACKKILVPLDGQRKHGDIAEPAAQIARCCSATIRLISVVPTFDTIPGKWIQVGRLLPGTTSKMLDIETEEIGDFLHEKTSALKATGIAAEYKVLRGNPGHMISVDAEESSSDIILMATHGKAGMSALWEGSVAAKVMSECKKPIMLLPLAD